MNVATHFDAQNTSHEDYARVLKTHMALVVENRVEKRHYHRLVLQAPALAASAQPGQYVHVRASMSSGFDPLLRRAFSILSAQEDQIEVLFRVGGKGTRVLSEVAVSATVDVLGPLGRPFQWQVPEAPTATILVGGGVGAPPLVFFATRWQTQVRSDHSKTDQETPLSVLLGARSEADLVCVADFEAAGIPVAIATDDGSVGERGLVTALLQQRLVETAGKGLKTVVHSCGPWPMLRAVAHLSRQYGARCYVSLEENMPCGIGVCNGCVVPVLTSEDDYGRYRRICVDGPVMDAAEVDWGRDAAQLEPASTSNPVKP